MIQGSCKNHPDRIARRRCFTCGAFICATCQIHAVHHYFCSSACQRKLQLRELRDRVLDLVHSLVPAVRLPQKQNMWLGVLAGSVLLVFVLPLVALSLVIFMHLRLQGRLEAIETSLKDGAWSPVRRASSALTEGGRRLRIAYPASGATVRSKFASIEGETAANVVVSLSAGEKLLAAAVPSDGRFAFSNLELIEGENRFAVTAITARGEALGRETVVVHYRPTEISAMASNFTRGDRKVRQIALTFDAGSNDNAAGPILEILQRYQSRATIFLTGAFIKNFPEITQQIVASGHEVGNHTWSHPHLTTFAMNYQHHTLPEISRESLHEQLQKTADLFEQVTGRQMAPLWRAPYGEHNPQIRQWASELGYRHVGWTVGRSADESLDTMDWVSDTTSASYRSGNEILEHLLRVANGDGDAANGGIVLMHLGSQRRGDEAYRILPQLIETLRASDYALVTVSQMLN